MTTSPEFDGVDIWHWINTTVQPGHTGDFSDGRSQMEIVYACPACQSWMADCGEAYGTSDITCTLPAGHDGDHEDHESSAPAVMTWQPVAPVDLDAYQVGADTGRRASDTRDIGTSGAGRLPVARYYVGTTDVHDGWQAIPGMPAPRAVVGVWEGQHEHAGEYVLPNLHQWPWSGGGIFDTAVALASVTENDCVLVTWTGEGADGRYAAERVDVARWDRPSAYTIDTDVTGSQYRYAYQSAAPEHTTERAALVYRDGRVSPVA